jgi:hypothetical protein
VSRRALVFALVSLAVSASATLPATGGSPRVGSSIYVVQPDPRLCPSPRCGGYWVQLANVSSSRCSNGVERARCYVARAVDEERHPLEHAISNGSLARAEIEPWRFEELGELGVLVVARTFAPVGDRAASGRYFRVVDRGIRCVRAPCFSLVASILNGQGRLALSGIGLGAAPVDARERIEAALRTKSGILARGRIVAAGDGGRILRASRFYLPSES